MGLVIGLTFLNEFVTFGVIAGTLSLFVQANLPASGLAIKVGAAAGLTAAIRLLLSIIAAPVAGTLSDRLGQCWPVALGSLVIGVVAMLLMAAANPRLAFFGLMFSALYGSSVRVVLTAALGDMVETARRGRALGAFNIGGDLGVALGPIVAFALLPIIGLSNIYLGCAVLLALGAMVIAWFWLKRSKAAARARNPFTKNIDRND